MSIGRFHDQIAICCAGFSDGGDSGSLIVTTGTGKNPVGLLFAGGGNRTFANRIDLVLYRFGVRIDGSTSPPPPAAGDRRGGERDQRPRLRDAGDAGGGRRHRGERR